ncbi:hypothetical protein ALT717_260002 [Alteromonas macleodii]
MWEGTVGSESSAGLVVTEKTLKNGLFNNEFQNVNLDNPFINKSQMSKAVDKC